MAYYQDPNAGYGYNQAPSTYSPQGGYQQGYDQQQQQTYQSQQAYVAPQQSYDNGGITQPLNQVQTQSQALLRLEREASLIKRDVYSHKNFDIDTLQDIEGLREMKYAWQFRWETILAMWVMFNAVSTIMIILTNFSRNVDPDVKNEYGQTNFDGLIGFITYFPLVYFLMAFLLVNNYYAEITFYMYLKRGCIIDFPPSANFKELFKRALPLIFLIITAAYLAVVLYAFIKFRATIGVVLIFTNNLVIGVGMSWYRQQSIEGKFVSVSNFIQAFPDRAAEYGNMDEQSLHSASRFLEKLTLTEAEAPSYSSYMREFYWANKNYPLWQKIWHHLFLFVIIGGLSGACIAYFVVLRGLDVESTWYNEINPCIQVCVGTYFPSLTINTCSQCTCRCLAALAYKDDLSFNGCGKYGSSTLCGALSPVCPSNINYCNFTK